MKTIFLTIAAFILALGNSLGQTKTPGVKDRQVNQQKRVHQGVKSGELTKKEAVQVQSQQAKIQRNKRAAKADGVVTPQERKQLHRQQNRASKNIYDQKHDEQSRPK